jgi:hypothetical protein
MTKWLPSRGGDGEIEYNEKLKKHHVPFFQTFVQSDHAHDDCGFFFWNSTLLMFRVDDTTSKVSHILYSSLFILPAVISLFIQCLFNVYSCFIHSNIPPSPPHAL